MKQKISMASITLLLIFTIISCGQKDVKEQHISSRRTESRVSDAAISSTPTENRNMDDRTYKVGNVPRNYNIEEPGSDRSLYFLVSILFVSLFFRIAKLNKMPGH